MSAIFLLPFTLFFLKQIL